MGLFSGRVPVILQSEAPECGIACLAMVASFHGHRTDLSAMRVRLSPSLKGVTLKHIAQIAETMGMSARGVQVPLESLGKLRLPAILHWDMNHFVVLTRAAGRRIVVHDPGRGKRSLTLDEASRHFTGVAMEFTPTDSFQKRDEREKIRSWQLLQAASGLKGTIAQILMLSFALEVFAIAMPFFLQLRARWSAAGSGAAARDRSPSRAACCRRCASVGPALSVRRSGASGGACRRARRRR